MTINKVEIEIPITKLEKVGVTYGQISRLIQRVMFSQLRPAKAKSFDSWYINNAGDIIGMTEYRHGSDSEENLGKPDADFLKYYEAFKLVKQFLDEKS